MPLLIVQNTMLGLLQLGSEPAGSMLGIDMTRYALVCFGLVVVILVLGWGFKRFLAGNMSLRANKRAMKVVDMLPLGGKRQLAVVRCYDRTFLLGLGEREVSLVTELDPDEDVEGRLSTLAAPEGKTFARMFQRAAAEPSHPSNEGPREEAGLGTGVLG